MSILLRATLVWLGFFVLAIVNGTIREAGLKRFIDEPWAHHISAITAIALFSSYGWAMHRILNFSSDAQAVWVGVYWFCLTVLTETFVIGRLLGHHSWEEILNNYNIAAGNLWPLVLIWIAILPFLIWRFAK